MDFWEFNEHSIDGKGRLVLPSSFRSAFEAGGVLSNLGDHIGIHTATGWEAAYRKMRDQGGYTPREMAVIRSFATRFTLDSQNRVHLPGRLRSAVGVEREVALIGMGDHIALYPRDRWYEIESQTFAPSDGGESLAERLAEAL